MQCLTSYPPNYTLLPAHCDAVTADGSLFTWGGNDSGQLGHGDTARLSRRRRVAALAREQVVTLLPTLNLNLSRSLSLNLNEP